MRRQALSLEQWDPFYRGGALATGATASEEGYDLELRATWVEFFSTLPDGARLLDLGTDNGAVALIAAETATALGRNWEIHATDLDGSCRLQGITFHPGMATEQLPFQAGSFDAVSGHYALEYTDTTAALAEIHRVLKTGGDAQFILHHIDSVWVRSAQWSLREAKLVFTETNVFRRLHRLVTMEQAVPGTTQRAMEELRAAIQALKQGLQQARQAGAGGVLSVALDAVQALLVARKDGNPVAIGLEVDRAEAELRASVRPLNDLIEHARTQQDMDSLEKEAAAAGFSLIECMPLSHAGQRLVGWQLLLRRA